jgi:hypothetical protein
MKIAFGYEDGWRIHVAEEDYGSFLHYEWRACPKKKVSDLSYTERLHATVLRTSDPTRDKGMAMEMIAAQFIRFNHRYWEGRVESDEAYDRRERRVAEKREVRCIDKEIATKLVDAVLADGYTITRDLMEDYPEFQRSTDRDAILDYMWQVEMVEMHVHKGKSRSWLRLIFDESGWDLFQDHSDSLSYLIDPIVEPYLLLESPERGRAR